MQFGRWDYSSDGTGKSKIQNSAYHQLLSRQPVDCTPYREEPHKPAQLRQDGEFITSALQRHKMVNVKVITSLNYGSRTSLRSDMLYNQAAKDR